MFYSFRSISCFVLWTYMDNPFQYYSYMDGSCCNSFSSRQSFTRIHCKFFSIYDMRQLKFFHCFYFVFTILYNILKHQSTENCRRRHIRLTTSIAPFMQILDTILKYLTCNYFLITEWSIVIKLGCGKRLNCWSDTVISVMVLLS